MRHTRFYPIYDIGILTDVALLILDEPDDESKKVCAVVTTLNTIQEDPQLKPIDFGKYEKNMPKIMNESMSYMGTLQAHCISVLLCTYHEVYGLTEEQRDEFIELQTSYLHGKLSDDEEFMLPCPTISRSIKKEEFNKQWQEMIGDYEIELTIMGCE